jgi:hypothetical protein
MNNTFKPWLMGSHHRGGASMFSQRLENAPKIPDPNTAAIAGIDQTAADFPFQYLVNALQQTGGSGQVINPSTGQPETLDFTGLGTADVQNQTQNQMAQKLLDLQNKYGSQYIAQALQDLQQSDPQGYQAYQQLYQKINDQQNQPTPNLPLAEGTQADEVANLKSSQTLSPEEQTQIQQQTRAGDLASGVYLGNAPEQAEVTNTINAADAQKAAGEAAAGKYLAEGVSPADLQYQQIQQDLSNYGAFINGQTPTAQFSQIGGAQGGAAPQLPTGYSQPTLNVGQSAGQGISQAEGIYGAQSNEANPYLAGLNFAAQGVGIAANAGLFKSTPNPLNEQYPFQYNSPYNSGQNYYSDPNFSASTPALDASAGTTDLPTNPYTA